MIINSILEQQQKTMKEGSQMIDFTNAIEEFNNYRGSEKKNKLYYI